MVKLQVIVHFPQDQNAIQALQETAAQVHAQAVISYIQNSSLSHKQADRVVDEIFAMYHGDHKQNSIA